MSDSEIIDQIMSDLKKEVTEANNKHGQMNSLHEAYSCILEELDELWCEIKKRDNIRDYYAMYDETIHVACTALRTAIYIKKNRSGGVKSGTE